MTADIISNSAFVIKQSEHRKKKLLETFKVNMGDLKTVRDADEKLTEESLAPLVNRLRALGMLELCINHLPTLTDAQFLNLAEQLSVWGMVTRRHLEWPLEKLEGAANRFYWKCVCEGSVFAEQVPPEMAAELLIAIDKA